MVNNRLPVEAENLAGDPRTRLEIPPLFVEGTSVLVRMKAVMEFQSQIHRR